MDNATGIGLNYAVIKYFEHGKMPWDAALADANGLGSEGRRVPARLHALCPGSTARRSVPERLERADETLWLIKSILTEVVIRRRLAGRALCLNARKKNV